MLPRVPKRLVPHPNPMALAHDAKARHELRLRAMKEGHNLAPENQIRVHLQESRIFSKATEKFAQLHGKRLNRAFLNDALLTPTQHPSWKHGAVVENVVEKLKIAFADLTPAEKAEVGNNLPNTLFFDSVRQAWPQVVRSPRYKPQIE